MKKNLLKLFCFLVLLIVPYFFLLESSFSSDNCNKKSQGDANCDGSIDDSDYNIWKCEFLGGGSCQNQDPPSQETADFNLDAKVDLIDFEIWRQNRFALKPTITNTPTPTRTPTPTPTTPPTCGNNTLDPGEECDGTNQDCNYLNGEICVDCLCVTPTP